MQIKKFNDGVNIFSLPMYTNSIVVFDWYIFIKLNQIFLAIIYSINID